MTTPGSAWPFVRPPRLPLVPPPHSGESLSGWIGTMSDAYGVGWREFLQVLGLRPPARLRSLSIYPPWPWLLALEAQTGVAAAFMRDHMAFEPLSTQMTWFVHRTTPCQACMAGKRPGGPRSVEWLADLAPWTLACERHSCPVLASEVRSRRLRDIIGRDVMTLARCLRATAFSDVRRPFPSVPLSAAACVNMVDAINVRLRLRLRPGAAGHAVFAVDDVLLARQVNEGSRPWPRNSRAVSAWYAWHVLAFPEVAFHRHTRCHSLDQTYDLLTVLFDFRHTGVLDDGWEYALSLCARANTDPDGTEEERQQVRRLHYPMFRSLIARPRTAYAPSSTGADATGPMTH